MKITKLFLIIAIILCYNYSAKAQPTITFYPSDGKTITQTDVNNTLEANGLTRESEFHAIIEVATVIEDYKGDYNPYKANVFWLCLNLLSVSSSSVDTIGSGAFWNCTNLNSVDFPNATYIGDHVFVRCYSLISVSFPNVKVIENDAFSQCSSLESVSFPNVIFIGDRAFGLTYSLNSVSLGTAHTYPTIIDFLFEDHEDLKYFIQPFVINNTPNIKLTLGEYVLPLPDIENKTWHTWSNKVWSDQDSSYYQLTDSYKWKNITIYTDVNEDNTGNKIQHLENNRYYIENMQKAEIYDTTGNLIRKYENVELLDLDYLPTGTYFIKYWINNIAKTEKILKY